MNRFSRSMAAFIALFNSFLSSSRFQPFDLHCINDSIDNKYNCMIIYSYRKPAKRKKKLYRRVEAYREK